MLCSKHVFLNVANETVQASASIQTNSKERYIEHSHVRVFTVSLEIYIKWCRFCKTTVALLFAIQVVIPQFHNDLGETKFVNCNFLLRSKWPLFKEKILCFSKKKETGIKAKSGINHVETFFSIQWRGWNYRFRKRKMTESPSNNMSALEERWRKTQKKLPILWKYV